MQHPSSAQLSRLHNSGGSTSLLLRVHASLIRLMPGDIRNWAAVNSAHNATWLQPTSHFAVLIDGLDLHCVGFRKGSSFANCISNCLHIDYTCLQVHQCIKAEEVALASYSYNAVKSCTSS